jgi:hypothetical protein
MSDDDDFASVIERSQHSPRTKADLPQEVNDLFERPIPRDHRVVREPTGEKIAGAIEYDYKSHVEYFHVPEQKDEYEEILDTILNAEAVLRYEDRTFTREGDCIVVICYLTRTENKERTASKQKAVEDAEREEYLRK